MRKRRVMKPFPMSSSKKTKLLNSTPLSKPFTPPTPSPSSTAPAPALPTTTKAVEKKVVKPMIRKRRPFKAPTPFKPPQAKPTSTATTEGGEGKKYYSVVWRKQTRKKHKTWAGDGVLVADADAKKVRLLDETGKEIAKSRFAASMMSLMEGSEIYFNSKECEVMGFVSEEDFLSGRAFLSKSGAPPPAVARLAALNSSRKKKPIKRRGGPSNDDDDNDFAPSSTSSKGRIARSSPLYSPDTPGAIVLHRDGEAEAGNGVSVVLAPKLAKILRPHQREGVHFMYDCVMGHKDFAGHGCILADEMGLGKTITALSLVHTLLSQSESKFETAAAEKAIVVTPSSLVKGWENEIRKWLGFTHLPPITIHNMSKKEITRAVAEFVTGRVKNLLIISYEQFRSHAKTICQAPVGLLVCDEGHRLKNAEIKTAKALLKLSTKRRIILTGTPVQNDLREFYTVVDFVNPGILGDYSTFKRIFEDPIAKSQERNAGPTTIELGKARSDELARITSQFILRRTQTMMRKYLPPKEEHVVFLKMNPLQEALYTAFARSKLSSVSASNLSFSWALACITTLKKICNHPALVLGRSTAALDLDAGETEALAEAVSLDALDLRRDVLDTVESYPSLCDPSAAVVPHLSTKMSALLSLLAHLMDDQGCDDKIVVVSNYTQTLELISCILNDQSIPYLRLDGSVAASKRPALVSRFNTSDLERVFLLSARAGGVGLNLIGANHLVMLDPDWNPATDLQAMGRVWRDGQKKRVHIYRFLTVGTIEEKIWQRQIMKQGLSDVVVDDAAVKLGGGSFTKSELKNLFKYNRSTLADTHDLLGCVCQGDGRSIDGMTLTPSKLESAQEAAEIDDALAEIEGGQGEGEGEGDGGKDVEAEKEIWSHRMWPDRVGTWDVSGITSDIVIASGLGRAGDDDESGGGGCGGGGGGCGSGGGGGSGGLVSFSFTSRLASQVDQDH